MKRFMLIAGFILGLGFFASNSSAQTVPANSLVTVNICTAKSTGNYHFVGQQIKAQAKNILNVVLIETAGSMENLKRLDDGSCDAAIVQSDAWGVYKTANPASQMNLEVASPLYPEVVHFICNADLGLTKITKLTPDMTVMVGENGSGTSVTWDSFVMADKSTYGSVKRRPIDGTRAVNAVKLGGSDASCMMYVAGLKSGEMMKANAIAAQSGGKLVLVPTDDKDLLKLKTPGKNGVPVYVRAEIPHNTYKGGLQNSWRDNSVNTVAVQALFVVNTKFIDANAKPYNALLDAMNNAMPDINARVKPAN